MYFWRIAKAQSLRPTLCLDSPGSSMLSTVRHRAGVKVLALQITGVGGVTDRDGPPHARELRAQFQPLRKVHCDNELASYRSALLSGDNIRFQGYRPAVLFECCTDVFPIEVKGIRENYPVFPVFQFQHKPCPISQVVVFRLVSKPHY